MTSSMVHYMNTSPEFLKETLLLNFFKLPTRAPSRATTQSSFAQKTASQYGVMSFYSLFLLLLHATLTTIRPFPHPSLVHCIFYLVQTTHQHIPCSTESKVPSLNDYLRRVPCSNEWLSGSSLAEAAILMDFLQWTYCLPPEHLSRIPYLLPSNTTLSPNS